MKRKDLSPVKHFYRVLNLIKEDIYHAITPREEMNLSEEEQIEFEKTQKCYVCAEKFGLNKHNLKNRDHCHKTGYVLLVNYLDLNIYIYRAYRGAACTTCNLKMKSQPEMNIYVHNLRGMK